MVSLISSVILKPDVELVSSFRVVNDELFPVEDNMGDAPNVILDTFVMQRLDDKIRLTSNNEVIPLITLRTTIRMYLRFPVLLPYSK